MQWLSPPWYSQDYSVRECHCVYLPHDFFFVCDVLDTHFILLTLNGFCESVIFDTNDDTIAAIASCILLATMLMWYLMYYWMYYKLFCTSNVLAFVQQPLVSSLSPETEFVAEKTWVNSRLIFNTRKRHYSTHCEQQEQREPPREMLCLEFIALHKHTRRICKIILFRNSYFAKGLPPFS